MNKLFFYGLLICTFFIFSSFTLKQETMDMQQMNNLPQNLSKYRELLLQKLNNRHMPKCLAMKILTITTKTNDVGIYSFKRSTPHLGYHLVFMYDGKNISFSDIYKEEELLLFMKRVGFSEEQIDSLPKKLEKIKKDNQELHEAQIF